MGKALIATSILLSLCVVLVSPLAQAANARTPAGRYLRIANVPTIAQQAVLSQSIQVHFPKEVTTLTDAMDYLLMGSGYRLAPINKQSPAMMALSHKKVKCNDFIFILIHYKKKVLLIQY